MAITLRTNSTPLNDPSLAAPDLEKKFPVVPVFLLISTFIIAILIETQIIPILEGKADSRILQIAKAISGSLFTAFFIGIIYELVLALDRDATFQNRLDDHRRRILKHIDGLLLLSPEHVFDILRTIAIQTSEIPTLYTPPREVENEYTFAGNTDYFQGLIEIRRREIVDILREWLDSSKTEVNLRFLASDFIGRFRLVELAGMMQQRGFREFDEMIQRIPQSGCIQDKDVEKKFEWVMNYLWAYSRCQTPAYKCLGDLLRATRVEVIQRWILFVPRQMPDPEFLAIIQSFLQRDDISKESRREALLALQVLQREGVRSGRLTAGKILKKRKIAALFQEEELDEIYEEIIRAEAS